MGLGEVVCGWISSQNRGETSVDSGFLGFGLARVSRTNRGGCRGAIGGPVGGRILVTSAKRRRLLDAYRFAGFRRLDEVRGVFGDPHARVVTLVRRSKKRPAARAEENIPGGAIVSFVWLGTFRPAACACSWSSRCRQGAQARLAYGEGAAQAVHAGSAGQGGNAGTHRDRDRGDLGPQGSRVSDRGQRPHSRAADLVRRRRSLGSKHGPMLSMAWRQEVPTYKARRDGRVEALSKRYQCACTAGRGLVRQGPRHSPLGRSPRSSTKEQVCTRLGEATALHQGPEIHAAVAQARTSRWKADRRRGHCCESPSG
jgi:hypothetical protein